jgi:uncharacterized protein (TIGR03435 family)
MRRFSFTLEGKALVMQSVREVLIVGVFAVAVASAQEARSFEVASIKPVAWNNYDEKHQGIKVDGQIADFGNVSLTDLVAYAFGVKNFQIIGPQGMGARFDILAKVPDGTAPGQVPEMTAQLLFDRFQMKFHKDNKEFSVYALIVGPKGAKLTPAPPDFKLADNPQQIALTMDRYTAAIARHFDKPVINETGLQGQYLILRKQLPFVTPQLQEAMARYKATGEFGGPSVSTSEPPGSVIIPILSDLGLKAEPRKRQLPVIVIDRIDFNATEQ